MDVTTKHSSAIVPAVAWFGAEPLLVRWRTGRLDALLPRRDLFGMRVAVREVVAGDEDDGKQKGVERRIAKEVAKRKALEEKFGVTAAAPVGRAAVRPR